MVRAECAAVRPVAYAVCEPQCEAGRMLVAADTATVAADSAVPVAGSKPIFRQPTMRRPDA